MKKILVLVCVLCFVGIGVFAQDLALSAGVQAGMSFYNLNDNFSSNDYGWNMTTFLGGVFFDATYIRLSADFQMGLGGQFYVNSTTTDFDSLSVSYINLTLLGKYPFDLGGIKIWPAIGLRYALALNYEINGSDFLSASNADLSDFYIVGGVGMDYDLGGLYITVQALYCLNLTANPTTNEPASGETISAQDIQISAGVGFGF